MVKSYRPDIAHPPDPRDLLILQSIHNEIGSRFSWVKDLAIFDMQEPRIHEITTRDDGKILCKLIENESRKPGRTIVIHINGGANPETVSEKVDTFYAEHPWYVQKRRVDAGPAVQMDQSGVALDIGNLIDELEESENG